MVSLNFFPREILTAPCTRLFRFPTLQKELGTRTPKEMSPERAFALVQVQDICGEGRREMKKERKGNKNIAKGMSLKNGE